ncbi:MAG: ASPIC/UnbV domain-containing protein, partial [bacterium]
GVKVYGEQRGAGLSDYDADGRVDLVVSQNGASTKLYHNVGAKAGLRIRLVGPKGNRNGVGATIRLVYENALGPAREVHLGSGYWSQNSMVQVMGLREPAKGVWVRWPGGGTTNVRLPAGASEVTVDFTGKLEINTVK